ncbi:hypothetical protein KIN20_038297 [Parelaphostrongylus tenuis]|uniref:WH1 domain-containing protein n=1 Tax=Parelaphostrongylus tenuis TaxID=148309 RepID=A0AAD5WMG5_PARTN|nr:hypothetical protein KIN20_038297 [Parelaphostrongylus tenuis]
MTTTFAAKKHRHTVYDVLLNTSVDDLLYKENQNNNNIFGFKYCRFFKTIILVIKKSAKITNKGSLICSSLDVIYKHPMATDIRNITNHISDSPADKFPRVNRISPHLTETERKSILTYLGSSAKALCTGICQLLQAENNIWKDTKVGVICFIRNPDIKEYVLSLLLPKSSGTSAAKVLWKMTVSAFFETQKTSDAHLLIFVMETFPRDVCGLHFYDPHEADKFHRILVTENHNRLSRRFSIPKCHAPPPPRAGGFEEVEKLNELPEAPTKSSGEKKHKKGFLGSIFTLKRKKRERRKLNISTPTEFKHIEHLGLEKLSVAEQEAFHHLLKEVDIQPGNEAQLQLIREIIATNGKKYEAQ